MRIPLIPKLELETSDTEAIETYSAEADKYLIIISTKKGKGKWITNM